MAGNLTTRRVQTAKPGKYSDGGNLYLIVSQTGSRKWVLRFTWRGRAKEMGLGGAASVPLADAREKAASARRKVAQGLNPIEERKRDNGIPTFGEMAATVREALAAVFRNEKHKAQWKMTLETYAGPLRDKPVDTITTDEVLAVLKPIWTTKAETAGRLRGRIEKVLDAAKAKGFRHGENPARWRGHLDHLLPKRPKLSRSHHPAMPYEDVPTFIGLLRDKDSLAGQALELCILTAARSGEVLGARWSEVDLEKKLWTVPDIRMKAGREHRVPLPSRAVSILRKLHKVRSGEFVFPSSFPRELVETAPAYVTAEQACRRSDALEKRRELMEAWASYCADKGAFDVCYALNSGAKANIPKY
jgi:integrase